MYYKSYLLVNNLKYLKSIKKNMAKEVNPLTSKIVKSNKLEHQITLK